MTPEVSALMRKFKVLLEWDREDGGYVVTVPVLPGCVTQGESVEESLKRAEEAILVTIEGMKLEGLPIPEGDFIVGEVELAI